MTVSFDWVDQNAERGLNSGTNAQSIQPPTAMTAGEPYAISNAYITPFDGTLEYYATDGECGKALEKICSEQVTLSELVCTDTSPTANHEYLVRLWVDATGPQSDAVFCPNVMCN